MSLSKPTRHGPLTGACAIALGLLGASEPATAGDVVGFATLARPAESWERGYGAALTSTWFRVLSFEGEAARMPGDLPDTFMTSFTASALLAPPIGLLTPYGGVGVGVFRQTLSDDSDLGTLRALVVGAKLRIGPVFIVKGEYRRYRFGGEPLVPITDRISAGAGISF